MVYLVLLVCKDGEPCEVNFVLLAWKMVNLVLLACEDGVLSTSGMQRWRTLRSELCTSSMQRWWTKYFWLAKMVYFVLLACYKWWPKYF